MGQLCVTASWATENRAALAKLRILVFLLHVPPLLYVKFLDHVHMNAPAKKDFKEMEKFASPSTLVSTAMEAAQKTLQFVFTDVQERQLVFASLGPVGELLHLSVWHFSPTAGSIFAT